jgi:hypothetical protein
MCNRIGSFVVVLAALMVSAIAVAIPRSAHAGKSSSTTNVTTIVHDTDSSGTQVLLRSDDFNGSGEATYSASLNANVQSYLLDGKWYLRLYNQSIRTLFITPNDGVNSSEPMVGPAALYWQNVEVAAACYDQNGNVVPLQNILTSSGNCGMIVDFSFNGTQYKIAMGPVAPAVQPGVPNPGLVSVTCNATISGQCVNWTITPNSAPSSIYPPTVANLYGPATRKSSGFIGQYYNTFRIDVTNP